MTVCIVGAQGMLGSDLLRALGPDRAVGLGHADADITDPEAIRDAIRRGRPHTVINCAAYTRVDDCESHRERAFAVNGDGARNVAAAATAVGARLVHVSTDYVFDGTATAPIPETAEPRPQTVYGASKLAGERAVRDVVPKALIVRTAWLFGLHGPNFIETILRLATERARLSVVNDQRGAPTATVDLAEALLALVQADATGIVHVTNSGSCTWYDYARFVLERAHGPAPEVLPVRTAEFPRPAPRPAYSVLDCAHYTALTGRAMPPWEDAVERYLQARAARAHAAGS